MNQNVRLTTTYYRNFVVLIVLPLIIVISVAVWFLRGDTLNASRDRVQLAQHSMIDTLMQDVTGAVMQFSHFLETGEGRLLNLSARVLTAAGQDNSDAVAELIELYEFLVPKNSEIAAVHFYARNGTYYNIREPLAESVRVRDVRSMNFYTEAMENPGRISIELVPPGVIRQDSDEPQPMIAVAYAVRNNDPDDLTELICLYITTRVYEMLQRFMLDPNQGEIYLINENNEIMIGPERITGAEYRLPDNIPWSTGIYPVTLVDGGTFTCIVRVIYDAEWELGWKLVTIISDSVLLEDFNRLAIIVIVISVVLFILYFAFSRNFLKNIVRPLNNLTDGMEKMELNMEDGSVKVYVEPTGQQEIRELAETFNIMAAHIGDLMRLKEGVFKASPVGLTMFDENYQFIDCNERVITMFNTTKNNYFNNYHDLSPEYQPDGSKSKDKFIEIMKLALNGEHIIREWMFKTPEDEPIPCEITLTRTERGGKFVGLGFIYDLRSIKNMQRNIQFLESEVDKIYYDALTGIYNRRYFDKNLDVVMKTLSRADGVLSLMMIDIDCFKLYNDTYGHSQGDECLRIVAKTLRDTVSRAGDFVVRYGGEEFSVVMPNTDEAGARKVAQELLENIRKENILHEATNVADIDYITFSIGITTGKVEYTQTPDDYIKYADTMLYHSKQNGRNRYTFGSMPPPIASGD
jgi:diguanylate cyclase (GGDEF)-like protein